MANVITFRSSRIVYYGPHPCDNCGVNIAKMGAEWGGTAFTYPEGPVYPNTEWNPHVCDPKNVYSKLAEEDKQKVLMAWPKSHPVKVGDSWFIAAGEGLESDDTYHIISMNQNYCDSPETAWRSAFDRLYKNNPTWHLHMKAGSEALQTL
jgi:hypothetical protein